MFNLLIAIISNTFENYVDDRERIDIQELLEILLDFSSIFAVFSGSRAERDKHYVHIFVKAEDDFKMVEIIKELAGDVKENQDKLKRMEKKMSKMSDSILDFKKIFETLFESEIKEAMKKLKK